MVASNIYVTPSTSLILIKSLAQPTTVYLSTLNVPNFEVKIRDATGLSSLATNPINISTIGGANFVDTTTYYPINQPYGFVNIGLRNSTIWQILHTSGQTPATAAATVGTTNISTLYLGLLSTASKNVSSLVLENLETPNSITLTGPFIIGNLSTPGFILLQSTLNVYGNTTFDKSLFVSGATTFLSSLSVETLFPLSSVLRSYSSVGAGGSLFVGGSIALFSTLHTQSTLQVATLAVEKSTPLTTVYANNLLIAGSISTVGSLAVSSQTFIQKNLFIPETVSSLSGSFSTGTLITGGNITLFGNISTLSSASFYSSFTTLSSLFINHSFSTLSTANITNLVSTSYFQTNLLSSGTSFSTSGDFSILSSLTVTGTLSSSKILVGDTFTTTNIYVAQNVSSFADTKINSFMVVDNSAIFNTLNVSTDIGIGGTLLHVQSNLYVDSMMIESPMFIASNFITRGDTIFEQNIGVQSNIYVKGNLTVFGIPYIGTFDVGSYEVSTLQITTSSPSVALRTSTLGASTVQTNQARLNYNPLSGDIQVPLYSSILVDTLYSKSFQPTFFSTLSLYTENVLNQGSLLPAASFPRFELYQKSSFPRGLSTLEVLANTVEANEFLGSFVGNGEFLSNFTPPFSTLSANTVSVSTVQTLVFSSITANLGNTTVVNNLTANDYMAFITPAYILPSTSGILQLVYDFYSTNKLVTIQSISESVLGINETAYFDSLNRKVGILTSTPIYDLDIRGSLYFSGTLSYSTINSLNFSTTQAETFFSSIAYSSLYARDNLIGDVNLIANDPTYEQGDLISYVFIIGERIFPADSAELFYVFRGIFTNSTYSTIDTNLRMFIYNNTKNVGINTITTLSGLNVIPESIPSSLDLVVVGNFSTTALYTSTLNIPTKLVVSSIEMPMLGINTSIVSTFNTLSTSFSSTYDNQILTMNSFVELFQNSSHKGSMHIKRPVDATYGQGFDKNAVLSVYRDAYISSVVVSNLYSQNVLFNYQDL